MMVITTDKTVCRVIAGVLAESGVTDVVISPGSRNAPLVNAMCADPKLRKTVIVDERQAAFIALGKAQVSQKTVALVCTSGTAVLNYAPAVAEACYQGLPLIVISADRPSQWIDQDDSQTIRQFRALDNIVKESYDLDDNEGHEMAWLANRTVNDALIVARSGKPGPVHINVHLDAPLGKTVDSASVTNPTFRRQIISYVASDGKISAEEIDNLAKTALDSRVLLIAGFMRPDAALNRAVTQFASLPNVAVMTETISNLHLQGDTNSIDVVLTHIEDTDKELEPDIVITIGGALISRKVKEYVRRLTPAEHWSLGHSHTTVDCFRCLTKRIDASEGYVLRKLAVALKKRHVRGNYSDLWAKARKDARESAYRFIAASPWSDLKALATLFDRLPQSLNLQLANGTSIRYAQLLTRKPFHSTFCNRGVSGIDGCLTTAIGAASATGRKTLLLIGDTAFGYDISALWLPIVPSNFKIVLLNNDGGGIFRFIDSTRPLPNLEEYFCAPQSLPVRKICDTFGYSYFRAAGAEELIEQIHNFLHDDSRPALLEIVTDPQTSADTLLAYMQRKSND